MKYEDILNTEDNSPATLSEPMLAQNNVNSGTVFDSTSMSMDAMTYVSQSELDSECYTLEESKRLLKAKVHRHFINV